MLSKGIGQTFNNHYEFKESMNYFDEVSQKEMMYKPKINSSSSTGNLLEEA